jgi:hypothetical protein
MRHDKTIFILGILFTILVTCFSGFLYYISIKKSEINTSSLAKKEIQKIAVATTKPVVDYRNIDIQILNATGVSGAAKKYADKLKALGYTKVTTGNNTDKLLKNKLLAPADFREDLVKIDFLDYEYEKNESIKIIIGK